MMIQRPRGTRDFLPDEMERRRYYENILRNTAKTFGFREIATPIFEESELFVMKSGPNILDEIYGFEDKGGRGIALRPELTAPVMRMFVNEMSSVPRPVKMFYFGQCFRYERPQSGRYREFFQFGAELISGANPESDAEVICLAASMIRTLGLKEYTIRIGHIGILKGMLISSGVPGDKMPEVLQKLDKKNYAEAEPLLKAAGVSANDADRIFRLTQTVGGIDVLDDADDDASQYLRDVIGALADMGITDAEVDMGVVRGLDYYTGVVFEAEAPALGAEKQICGGGSYSLTELFGGESVFSTGFAIGFDRILLAMEKEGLRYAHDRIDAYIIPVSDDVRSRAAGIAASLRSAGIRTDIDLMRRKMSKAMKYASSVNSRYVIIAGAKELENDSVTLRDMTSGDQSVVNVNELAEHITGDPVHH